MLPEFSRSQLLSEPPKGGVTDELEASPAECAALARRFGIEALAHFSARFGRKTLMRCCCGMRHKTLGITEII